MGVRAPASWTAIGPSGGRTEALQVTAHHQRLARPSHRSGFTPLRSASTSRDQGLGTPPVQHHLHAGIIREGEPKALANGRLVVGDHDEPASRRYHATRMISSAGARTERWDRQPEGLGRPEVDDQLELGRLLDGQLAGLGALEDLVDVGRGAPVQGVASSPP